jgi:squalene-hopene/tetraprenyl-beta-curcumene cyclase
MTVACLHALGLPTGHDGIVRGLASLRRLRRRDATGLRVISRNADVWSTAIAARVLHLAGHGRDAVPGALRHLLLNQSATATPREMTNGPPGAPKSGGWALEAGNPLGADCDTTSMALLALAEHPDLPGATEAIERGLGWLRAMAHEGGGFAASGRPRHEVAPGSVVRVPPPPPTGPLALARFLLDPGPGRATLPGADVTGRVVCAFARLGADRAALRGAVAFLYRQQQGDRWWGLAGTAFVLHGLCAAGEDPAGAPIRRAVAWMLGRQNPDGGWGETNDANAGASLAGASLAGASLAGNAPSDASLTGLVLQALSLTGDATGDASTAAARAARYLLATQGADGLWPEAQAVQSVAPPELFHRNYVNFQSSPIEALAVYVDRRRSPVGPAAQGSASTRPRPRSRVTDSTVPRSGSR